MKPLSSLTSNFRFDKTDDSSNQDLALQIRRSVSFNFVFIRGVSKDLANVTILLQKQFLG